MAQALILSTLFQPVRANCGQFRAFQSHADATAYGMGWAAFPALCRAEVGTPAWMGWADRRDEVEAFAAMDDCSAWAATHPRAIGLHLP